MCSIGLTGRLRSSPTSEPDRPTHRADRGRRAGDRRRSRQFGQGPPAGRLVPDRQRHLAVALRGVPARLVDAGSALGGRRRDRRPAAGGRRVLRDDRRSASASAVGTGALVLLGLGSLVGGRVFGVAGHAVADERRLPDARRRDRARGGRVRRRRRLPARHPARPGRRDGLRRRRGWSCRCSCSAAGSPGAAHGLPGRRCRGSRSARSATSLFLAVYDATSGLGCMSAAVRYTTSLEGIKADALDGGFWVGWPTPPTADQHLAILQGSEVVVLAIDDETGRVVGFVTAVGDGVLAAYLPLPRGAARVAAAGDRQRARPARPGRARSALHGRPRVRRGPRPVLRGPGVHAVSGDAATRSIGYRAGTRRRLRPAQRPARGTPDVPIGHRAVDVRRSFADQDVGRLHVAPERVVRAPHRLIGTSRVRTRCAAEET